MRIKDNIWNAVLVVILVFLVLIGVAKVSSTKTTEIRYEMETDFGPLTLFIDTGTGVAKGEYSKYEGRVSGLYSPRDGGTVSGFWYQRQAKIECGEPRGYDYEQYDYWGSVTWRGIDDQQFQGEWAYCDEPEGEGGIWSGVRVNKTEIKSAYR